ncbi:MAG: hypothetical protein H6702_06940 [Myxococcales bacterium]|nr:hypothetical protein [Myxococcales bacterium]
MGILHIPRPCNVGRVAALALWACACLAPAAAAPPEPPWAAVPFQKGVVYSSWDGSYPHRDAWQAHLDELQAWGVEWIQVMTFAHQPAVDGPGIEPAPAERWPGAFVDAARRRGLRILLKPHVWSRQFYDGSKRWRGDIRMDDPAEWARWFDQYERFIVREAQQAARHGVETLSVGLEYVHATKPAHTARWRALIQAVRRVYPGQVLYAADGNHELDHIAFWDALDAIGVNAYFSLGDAAHPAALAAAWVPHLARLEALATRHRKPILLTEAGYPSVEGAAARPWQWPTGREVADPLGQAQAYQALLVACTGRPWCRGVYWWKLYERPESTPLTHDYTPRGKPALDVLRRWYGRPIP